MHAKPRYGVEIVRELFTSNTLVKLTLSDVYCPELDRVFLPVLKSVSILSTYLLDYQNYCRLVDGCPVREELFITEDYHSYSPICGAVVDCASVKRVVVFVNLLDSQENHDYMLFNAPSLVYLDYSSYICLPTGLVHRVTSRCGDACACIPKKQRKIVNEEEELCCLWTCQVKMLKISEYGDSFQELETDETFFGQILVKDTFFNK
ncbi:hypothetical protein EUTSA_v10012155mg [Eutrema salsugineum]|uniref:Uncharacterized protein n=1 Tax=Eutrema salsugineum TaxID=72664 RepID=V4KL64_EUTSA|nr:hypothetical protein EUTSA_v10012155mg [Eutrema salsugineum]